MKDILSNRWQWVLEKVKNLAKEVFEEVMEQEMALAQLETVVLDDSILPKEFMKSQQRSLLKRLNTFKSAVQFKKSGMDP